MIPLAASRMSRGYAKEDIRAEGIWARTHLGGKKKGGKENPESLTARRLAKPPFSLSRVTFIEGRPPTPTRLAREGSMKSSLSAIRGVGCE